MDPYPPPCIENIFAELQGGQTFTKIDLPQASTQIPVDEESQQYLTVNTHLGLFRVKQLNNKQHLHNIQALLERVSDA